MYLMLKRLLYKTSESPLCSLEIVEIGQFSLWY